MRNVTGILLGAIVLLLVALLYFGFYPLNSIPNTSNTSSNTLPNRKECEYGVFDYNYYIYEVKPGDTITAVAKNELANFERAGELILLNKEKYPTLVTQPGYLEKGWKLKLPPREIIITREDQLLTFRGHVHENSAKYFRVSVSPDLSNTYIYDSAATNYFSNNNQVSKQDIPTGVCFDAVIENDNRKTNAIISLRAKQ